MKKNRLSILKKHPIWATLITMSLASFALIFISSATLIASLSLAFTAVASIATLVTFIIALKLYDRFGLKNIFIMKQAEKVLELFDELTEQVFTVDVGGFSYILRLNTTHLKSVKQIPHYQNDHEKKILIVVADYHIFYDKIGALRSNKWMPASIHDKMDFLELLMTASPLEEGNYVKLSFSQISKDNTWVQPTSKPTRELTIDQLINHLIELAETMDAWFKEHCDIDLPLRLTNRY